MVGFNIADSLIRTESSGNPDAHIQIKDGREFFGIGQLGLERLKEVGLGKDFTLDEYRTGPNREAIQRMALDRDIANTRRIIADQGIDKYYGTTINGMPFNENAAVAIAHLGGREGLRKYVETGGKYNPTDELGTSLSDYHRTHGVGMGPTIEAANTADGKPASRLKLDKFNEDMITGSNAAREWITTQAEAAGITPKERGGGGGPRVNQKLTPFDAGIIDEQPSIPPELMAEVMRATQPQTPNEGEVVVGTTTREGSEGAAPEKQTLLDKIGGALFPNAEDPTDKFKTMLGGLGVGLGQMSAGQAVNLQPYFSQIAARRQAASQAIQDANQQRIDNQIRMGTLANQTRQTDINAAKLAHDVSKSGVNASPADYEAIAQTYPELASSGLIEAAMMGNKDASKEITTYIGDRLADSAGMGDDSKAALNNYIAAGDDVQKKVDALSGLSPDQAEKVTKLAGEITGDESLPSNWQTAELLAKDMPHLYKSAGEAFQAIEKMRSVMGGEDLHPDLIKANIKAGTDLQTDYVQSVRTANDVITTASQARGAVKDLIKSGASQNNAVNNVGQMLGSIPMVGIDAREKFYDAIGFDAVANNTLTQAQATMLGLIAKEYQGQGELSDREREDMAKRVLNGTMSEEMMLREIAKMETEARFDKGDATYFRTHASAKEGYANYAEVQEQIGSFADYKNEVLRAQQDYATHSYWSMESSPSGYDKDAYTKHYLGEENAEKLAQKVLPMIPPEFAEAYASSLPKMKKTKDGKPVPTYIDMNTGEIVYLE